MRKIRPAKFKDIDEALINWFNEQRSKKEYVSISILREKAKEYYEIFYPNKENRESLSW